MDISLNGMRNKAKALHRQVLDMQQTLKGIDLNYLKMRGIGRKDDLRRQMIAVHLQLERSIEQVCALSGDIADMAAILHAQPDWLKRGREGETP